MLALICCATDRKQTLTAFEKGKELKVGVKCSPILVTQDKKVKVLLLLLIIIIIIIIIITITMQRFFITRTSRDLREVATPWTAATKYY